MSQHLEPGQRISLNPQSKYPTNQFNSLSPLGVQSQSQRQNQPKQKYLNFAAAPEVKSSVDKNIAAYPRRPTLERIEEETDQDD